MGTAPLQPPPGDQPLDPHECLVHALSLLASLAVVWAPHVEHLPKYMPWFIELVRINVKVDK